MLDIRRTEFADFAPDIAPLLKEHWKELHSGRPHYALVPDLDIYCAAEDAGHLFAVCAREDGKLIGYALVLAFPRPHSKDELVGVLDALYVMPEHRSNGVAAKMLGATENVLREAGVKTVSTGVRDPRIIRWLRMTGGYVYTETILEKGL